MNTMENKLNRFKILSGSMLKLIAFIAMFIDHVAYTFVDQFPFLEDTLFCFGSTEITLFFILRRIGRLAFPIFCFLIAEGIVHTRDIRVFGARLLGFAVVSEVAFDMMLTHRWVYLYKQNVFFTLFLGVYLTTVLGNLLILLLIRLDSHLHTPMYFFLSHLALTDISFSSVTVPKMLINMQTQGQSIPYAECVTQMYFFIFFTDLDDFLLTSMAYDRYVAICHPLHPPVMGQELCTLLVTVSWIPSCANALCHTLLLTRLSFCVDLSIPHFFCDLGALLKLSCSDTSLNELAIFTAGVAVIVLPLICILISYGCIGVAILKVPSTKGICKALSTCGSHLSVVSLFYGTIMALYFSTSSGKSNDTDMIASLMYTVVTPMLNPFIYSLRNRDMKLALGILFRSNNFLIQ